MANIIINYTDTYEIANETIDLAKDLLGFVKEAQALSEKERFKNRTISFKEKILWNLSLVEDFLTKLVEKHSFVESLMYSAILELEDLDDFLQKNEGSDSSKINKFIEKNSYLLDRIQDLEW